MKTTGSYAPMTNEFALSESTVEDQLPMGPATSEAAGNKDKATLRKQKSMTQRVEKPSMSFMEQHHQEEQELIQQAEDKYPEYKNITTNAGVDEDIPCDCWGALIFVIVKDLPDIYSGRAVVEGYVRTLFVFFAFALNYVIQWSLLFYIWKLLMMPGIEATQDVYRDFHADVWTDEGTFNKNAFTDMSRGRKDALCGLALSQGGFLRVFLILWVSNNVGELRDNWSKTKSTIMMPALPQGLDTRLMVRDLPQAPLTEYCVCCLNKKTKVGLLLLVWLPQFLIVVVLSLLGSVWLISAQNTADLILNSLALGFVVKVDELIAMSFFPKKMIRDIEDLCLLLPSNPEEDIDKLMWNRAWAFFQSSFVVAACMGIVEVIVHFQPVLPHYEYDVHQACLAHINQLTPWCSYWRTDCFPKGR
jgi:uncharacterized membrane protein YkgB